MPKPTAARFREEAKARVRAKVEAARALSASEQIANTLHATRTAAEAQALIDQLRAEVLAEAIEAARGEYLNDDTRTPEDEAYNQAVSDVVAAIGALTEGGAA